VPDEMVSSLMTLSDRYPGFMVTVYKSNIRKTVRFRDIVTKEHALIGNYKQSTENVLLSMTLSNL